MKIIFAFLILLSITFRVFSNSDEIYSNVLAYAQKVLNSFTINDSIDFINEFLPTKADTQNALQDLFNDPLIQDKSQYEGIVAEYDVYKERFSLVQLMSFQKIQKWKTENSYNKENVKLVNVSYTVNFTQNLPFQIIESLVVYFTMNDSLYTCELGSSILYKNNWYFIDVGKISKVKGVKSKYVYETPDFSLDFKGFKLLFDEQMKLLDSVSFVKTFSSDSILFKQNCIEEIASGKLPEPIMEAYQKHVDNNTYMCLDESATHASKVYEKLSQNYETFNVNQKQLIPYRYSYWIKYECESNSITYDKVLLLYKEEGKNEFVNVKLGKFGFVYGAWILSHGGDIEILDSKFEVIKDSELNLFDDIEIEDE